MAARVNNMRRISFNKKHRPHMTWLARERPTETAKQKCERLELERGLRQMANDAKAKDHDDYWAATDQ